jgi:hypothetical protein
LFNKNGLKSVYNIGKNRIPPSADVSVVPLIDVEGWEEVKDVFFMLKLPIDVDIDFDRFSSIMSKRRRKIGLCGPRGVASVQFRTDFVSLSENVQEIN